jgi:hypothetical protein
VRLPEDQIKEALLHPDIDVRDAAVRYFYDSPSADATLMPLAIEAIERYGRMTAFSWTHYLNHLPQTEQTIDWVMAELQRDLAGRPEELYFYRLNLSRLLCHADVRLVAQRAPEIFHAAHFDPKERPAFRERLEMFAWDAAKCWQALHDYCEANRDKDQFEEFDVGHALRIVEALARQPHEYAAQIVSGIAAPVHDDRHDGSKWLQPLLAKLAGEMRLQAAIEPLVGNLGHRHSFLSDQSVFALAGIGNDAVVAAVADRWPSAARDFRLYAAELLCRIHLDSTVECVLKVLPGETDPQIRMRLCEALLYHFSGAGIEPARQFIAHHELTPDVRRLRTTLIVACKVLGSRFPQFEAWQQEAWRDFQQESASSRNIEKMAFEAGGDLRHLIRKLQAEIAATKQEKQRLEAQLAAGERRLASVRSRRSTTPGRIGRNDPCPCRSGKKFKHCCMRTQQ